MWFGVCVSKRAGERAAGAELGPGSAPGTAGDERDQSRHGRSLVLPSSAGFIGQPSPITLICGIKEKSISIREVMCGGFTGLVGHGATGAAWALPVPVPGSVTGARLAVQEEALELWRSPRILFFQEQPFLPAPPGRGQTWVSPRCCPGCGWGEMVAGGFEGPAVPRVAQKSGMGMGCRWLPGFLL